MLMLPVCFQQLSSSILKCSNFYCNTFEISDSKPVAVFDTTDDDTWVNINSLSSQVSCISMITPLTLVGKKRDTLINLHTKSYDTDAAEAPGLYKQRLSGRMGLGGWKHAGGVWKHWKFLTLERSAAQWLENSFACQRTT
jgi:hypothetical protein